MNIYTIYKATNVINGKSYIGFTQNYKSRKRDHQKNSEKYNKKHKNITFYDAVRKYGWESFEWSILYQSKDKDHTKNEMETYFITEYRTYLGFDDCKGYNMTLGGEGCTGIKFREESKEKIRSKAVERYKLEENRIRTSVLTKEAMKNLDEECKERMKAGSIGKISAKDAKTGEMIGKVSIYDEKVLSGEWVHNLVGFNHSEETKQKMSKSKKGKNPYIRTEETNKNISLGRTGKGTGERNGMANEENRKKVAESKIGRKKYINPETNAGKYCFPGTEPEGFILASLLNTP